MTGEGGLDNLERNFTYPQELIGVIGPLYRVESDGRDVHILDFCKRTWSNDKIPFLFGRQGMGKSFILQPYLEQALDALILEPKDPRFSSLRSVPKSVVLIARVHGRNERHHEVECDRLTETVCSDSYGLFDPEKFLRGRLDLVVNEYDVDRMALALTGGKEKNLGIRYKLNKGKVVAAFRQFDLPVINGVAKLKNLLGIS